MLHQASTLVDEDVGDGVLPCEAVGLAGTRWRGGDIAAHTAFVDRAHRATMRRFAPAIASLADASDCLYAWLQAEVASCGDELFARRFQRLQPTFHASWQAFLPRIVDVGDGHAVLAGIRFKGGDPAQPFVRVAACTCPDPSVTGWTEALREAFAPFGPEHIQVRWPGQHPPCDGAVADQHHVMGRLTILRDQPRPWGEVGVDVRVATGIDFTEALARAFAAWRNGVGPRHAEVHMADRSDLDDALATGIVVTAHQGAQWRGVMAARRAAHRFADGYEVVELFLDAPLRGARRAHVMQRRLIDALVDHGRDVLWGTIHASNRPSLRTARRCGRRVVETSWFVPMDG